MARQKRTISSRNLDAGSDASGGGLLEGIMKPLADLLVPTKRSGRRASGGATRVSSSKGGKQRALPKKGTGNKSFKSTNRPPHKAQVTVTRNGRVVSDKTLTSGNMTAEERALGFPRSSLATHTENRAMRDPDLRSGDRVVIKGQYAPCPSCKGAMNDAADKGIHVQYHWPDSKQPWIAGRKK